jgi:hypothetical protein
MAWVKDLYQLRRPSVWLGFLLFGLIFCGISLFFWERTGTLLFFWEPEKIDLEKAHGVAVFAAFLAAIGWTVTSLVTLRNSVKQHTMNTLLQTRLSATYMEHVKTVTSMFSTINGELIPLTYTEVRTPPHGVDFGSLSYMLNYFEYVAVGIRHGDLNEGLLKASLRGIVCSIFCVAEQLIAQRRAELGPYKKSRSYENLVWLHERWEDPEQLSPKVLRTMSNWKPKAVVEPPPKL